MPIALIPAGMRRLLAYVIKNRFVDVMVCSGGMLFHDLHETLGRQHFQAHPSMTDAELAKYFAKPIKVQATLFANASAQFEILVKSGKLRWVEADAVTDDLIWTAKKADADSGSFKAVRADDERPITASLAAIRAVWMASTPAKSGAARIY